MVSKIDHTSNSFVVQLQAEPQPQSNMEGTHKTPLKPLPVANDAPNQRPIMFLPLPNQFTPNMYPNQAFILPSIKGNLPPEFFANLKAPISKVPVLQKPKVKRKTRVAKRNPRREACANCKIDHSPLWRKGDNQRPLCNKCGLYWSRHGFDRPATLERAKRRSNNGEKKLETRKIGPKEGFVETRMDFSTNQTYVQKPFRFYQENEVDKTKFMDLMFGNENKTESATNQFILEESEEDLVQKKDQRPVQTSLFFNDYVFNLSSGNQNEGNAAWWSPNDLKKEFAFQGENDDQDFDLMEEGDLSYDEEEVPKQESIMVQNPQ